MGIPRGGVATGIHSTRMFIAAPWLSARRVPLTWHRLVVLPDIFVTKTASLKPISRNRWQKCSSPLSSQTCAVAPEGSWQSGESFLGEVDIEAETEYQNRIIKKPRVNRGVTQGLKSYRRRRFTAS